jgi:predicted metalloprotease with PDZ domain
MMHSILLLLVTLCTAGTAAPDSKVTLEYTLTVNAADLSTYAVELRIRNAPASLTLAAHAHPEYDDKYWRFVEDMRVEARHFARPDSVRWEITGAGNDVTIRYVIRPPIVQPPRAAWRAFLTANGGVVGGPHSFLYLVGQENAPATVQLNLPAGWTAASGMTRDAAGKFLATDIFTLMESPIMVGRLHQFTFDVANTPHEVFYLPGAAPTAFDTTAFLGGVQKIVQQTLNIFGKAPYERYVFMFSDDAYGGLEHPNSVTLGAPSAELAKNPYGHSTEIAHEFFHTWNLMRFKPIEYRRVDYRVQPPVTGLWFSEGLSMFYADLLQRRAGFIMSEPTRIAHLEGLVSRYLDNPGYARFSAEQVSRTEYNSEPGVLGNHDLSSHQLGELIGATLDLIIRNATNGSRNMDDVMRSMDERHSTRGFTSTDIERVVSDVCGCVVKGFFDNHVRGAADFIDINRYLEPFGLRAVATRRQVTSQNGEVERDLRIRAWQATPDDTLRLLFWTPASIWVRAGLNTNDRVLSVNGVAVKTWPELRTQILAVPLDGVARVEVMRPTGRIMVDVRMTGYDRTMVRIEEVANASERQRRLRSAWEAGK